ncbi:MAG: DNA-binding protein [Chloroflexi bacterium]|nr:MAG: DNA-binding protein [Chloroflexota bacterium]
MENGSNLPEGLASPVQRALEQHGLLQLEKIAELSESELKQLHGIGPKAIEQLRQAMAAQGLSFKGE